MRDFIIEYEQGFINCDVCFQHENKKIAKINYVTRNYESAKRKGKSCKTPQIHKHSIWICDECLEKLRKEWEIGKEAREMAWN